MQTPRAFQNRFQTKFQMSVLSLCLLAACSQEQTPQTQAPADEPTAAATAAAQGPEVIAFTNARVIIGDESAPIEGATFLVSEGRFAEVGPANAVTIPEGATQVDLTGATVMPTIIDTHVHLSQDRPALETDLRNRARFGVSAAMSLGQDQGEVPFQVQKEIIPGAALYRTAGRGITAPEEGRTTVPHWITTEEEARTAVRDEAALGVDIIKIWVDDRNGQYMKLSPELYKAVIDEAHANNLRVVAHIFNLSDGKELLRSGLDAFAHGVRDIDIDDEFVTLLGEHPDVVLGPNLPDRGVVANFDWLEGQIPAEQLAQLRTNSTDRPDAQATHGIQARNLKRMSDAGVTIVVGTDGNTPWAPHVEMEDMVLAGMTPAAVIEAATSNGAEYMHLENTGSIEEGNSADFIILNANPLDDITNTRQIRDVYIRGDKIERSTGA